MGFMDKFKVLVGIDEEDEEEYEDEVVPERKPADVRPLPQPRQENKEGRVVAMAPAPAPAPAKSATTQLKLVVTEPQTFDECPKLVDSLKARKPIIINLEKVETDVARKIFDFLSGATYALSGNVQRISSNIFVFTPENVEVMAGADNRSYSYTESIRSPWR
ncbi:MAG: cell division protein SepF [Firmicutes bacterium]|nr:cell division protein SepF [Clostridiales bacterium]MBQ9930966.1 cell division protein SepF [Bacillota bacterium]